MNEQDRKEDEQKIREEKDERMIPEKDFNRTGCWYRGGAAPLKLKEKKKKKNKLI